MKAQINLLVIALVILFSCEQSHSPDNPKIEKGMIKMAIFSGICGEEAHKMRAVHPLSEMIVYLDEPYS